MTATPAKSRKAQERERKRALGLVPVEVWVRQEHVPRLREYVRKLAK